MFFTQPKKTVDSVVSAFHAVIADLQEVAQVHTDEAEQHAKTIAEATQAKAQAEAEAARASTAVAQFNKLVGNI